MSERNVDTVEETTLLVENNNMIYVGGVW